MVNLIHFSDTHFGDPDNVFDYEAIRLTISDFINQLKGETLIIVTGDITFKGQNIGYIEAARFFSRLLKECKISSQNFIACPGNHDLGPGKGDEFKFFNDFIYSIRKDNEILFKTNSFTSLKKQGIFFLVANSSYHLDHTFGLVDRSMIDQIKNFDYANTQYRIALIHHHLLGIEKADSSTLRNAHPFLWALINGKFQLILHGHQHINMDIKFGDYGLQIKSARSTNFSTKGFNNGINHVIISEGRILTEHYHFSKDADPTRIILVRG